jgi:hypothetical protein
MVVVLYKNDNTVVEVINTNNFVVDGDKLIFDSGEINGIKANYKVFPDGFLINIGDILTADQLSQALKTDFSPESQQHSTRIANLELTVISLMNKLAGV